MVFKVPGSRAIPLSAGLWKAVGTAVRLKLGHLACWHCINDAFHHYSSLFAHPELLPSESILMDCSHG